MVCNRCVMTVKEELAGLGHVILQVGLGEATILNEDVPLDKNELKRRLAPLGFSLLEDRRLKIAEGVKGLVEEVYGGTFDFPDNFRFTRLLTERLGKDYAAISDAFIAMEKKTIEQYVTDYRINKVKDFLVYSQLTLSDIAFRLHFNSVAHLSTRFKQVTGLTPSYFREIKRQKKEVIFSLN